MAEREKLQSFKAGALQTAKQKTPGGKKKQSAASSQEVATSIGFERIEKLLDEEVPGEVGQKMANLLEDLAELEKTSRTPKAKSGAKKARVAVEHTIELLDYLYQVKQGLLQQKVSPTASKE